MLGDFIEDGRGQFASGVHAREICGFVNADAVLGRAACVKLGQRCLHFALMVT